MTRDLGLERREAPRRSTDLPARFRVICGETGRRSKEVPAAFKNLSQGGLCLTTDLTRVDGLHIVAGGGGIVPNRLEIRLELPHGVEIRVVGRALWYDLAAPDAGHRYEVGIKIQEIGEHDLAALRAFLRRERRERWLGRSGVRWLERILGGR